MGWENPPLPWAELERRLSGRPPTADGGDSPAWSNKRAPYDPPPKPPRRRGAVAYAELHCHSNFSFLDGASHPEELVEEAVRLGLAGWVRHRRARSVEAVLAGDEPTVEMLLLACRCGPTLARVDSIEERFCEMPEEPGFRRLPTL